MLEPTTRSNMGKGKRRFDASLRCLLWLSGLFSILDVGTAYFHGLPGDIYYSYLASKRSALCLNVYTWYCLAHMGGKELNLDSWACIIYNKPRWIRTAFAFH